MLKCARTISGVLMIVGLGFLAGAGHSLLAERPIVLGPAATVPPPTIPAPGEGAPPDGAPADTDDDGSTADASGAEKEDPLDAPVPEGMLTLRQAHQQWIDGAYFIDSRRRDQFIEGRVAGAAYLTAENIFSDAGDEVLASIPPDAPVVIYCTGGEGCDASKNTMALLQPLGYTNLLIMGSGYAEWEAAGLPTDSGEPENTP